MSDTEDESLLTAEYAKSSRSKCKLCEDPIEQGDLRLGVKVQSSKLDRKITSWYHLDCFFVRQRPKGTFDISGFENLRPEHQTAIEDRISGKVIPALPEEVKKRVGERGEKLKLRDYKVEYATTGRSKCRKCVENIDRGDIRLSKRGYSPERAKMFGPQDRFYHVDCFAKNRRELDFTESAETIPGFDQLSMEDKNLLKEKLPDLQEGDDKEDIKEEEQDKTGVENEESLEEPEHKGEEPEGKKLKSDDSKETTAEKEPTKADSQEELGDVEANRAD
ncbi:poly [ADP-ribose] polymerase-like [Artemia franciscana]|uniref:PARP-type domain-containing protein n=1 Tax=Artemia franciscana TaxID=6661 RepID=A0AA88LHN7_ARTSF|nr:hypothetical protein QYM36_001029 [Artemia franciscana]